MILEGPKWLAIGSKTAHFTCLFTSNGLGSFLEEHIFDPFLNHFWLQNNAFSRHFVTLEGPKWLAMGSRPLQRHKMPSKYVVLQQKMGQKWVKNGFFQQLWSTTWGA